MKKFFFLPLAMLAMTLVSCSSDDDNLPTGGTQTGGGTASEEIYGMYILNEGLWGANNATIDFLNLSVPPFVYATNVYNNKNVAAALGLGDVGNDMKIYGSKLYIVVNGSNKLVIADARTCEKLAKVDIPNCHNLAFSDGYAYVSSYVGSSMESDNASPGSVYKIDTLTMKSVGRVDVGLQPEELAVSGRMLYVANSGGYNAPNYDRTVSVIDLIPFTVSATLDVDINLHRLKADNNGRLWVTSRGNYADISGKLYCIDTRTSSKPTAKKILDKAPSNMCIVGDSLYYYASEFNYTTNSNTNSYGIINVETQQQVATTLFKSPADEANITTPYGIIVNPIADDKGGHDFYITDAIDYMSSGKLHHFNADGSYDCSYTTGIMPNNGALLFK